MKIITRDPLSGMDVEESSPIRADHEGITYLFCSEQCREKFLRDPGQFTHDVEGKEEEPSKRTGGPGSEKVRQKGRGSKWTDYIPLIVILALTFLPLAPSRQPTAAAGTG